MSPRGKKRKESSTSSTIVMMVIDKSGSMCVNKETVVSSFNEYLQTVKKQKKKGDKMLFSMLQFDDQVYAPDKYNLTPIEEVKEMTLEDYCPSGLTAMYDGIGVAMNYIDKELEGRKRKPAVLFVIITDGEENSSREYKSSHIKKMIGKCDKKGNYSFIFLGANQDAWAASSNIGIKASNTAIYTSTASGTKNMMESVAMASLSFSACARGNADGVAKEYNAFNGNKTVIADEDLIVMNSNLDSKKMDIDKMNTSFIGAAKLWREEDAGYNYQNSGTIWKNDSGNS